MTLSPFVGNSSRRVPFEGESPGFGGATPIVDDLGGAGGAPGLGGAEGAGAARLCAASGARPATSLVGDETSSRRRRWTSGTTSLIRASNISGGAALKSMSSQSMPSSCQSASCSLSRLLHLS